MRKLLLIIAATLICGISPLRAAAPAADPTARPRLVVGVVVDQMRWDYLRRYYPLFGEGGFRRLMGEGFSCDNTQLNYIPTVTAIGHSSIYTGSVPSIHGIAGNNFYKNGKQTYCTDDDSVETVGAKGNAGKMSPRNLLVTTIGDELRLATNFRSRVIGISLKDRASILPAGHAANGAYWFDDGSGRFITSTYYAKSLPEWLTSFNAEDNARKYLRQPWATLLSPDKYTQSTKDDTPYEKPQIKGSAPTLPLDLPALFKQKGYAAIRTTPFGNTLTLEAAKAAVNGEKLGQGTETDMLCVSLSSTDYVGHQYGVNAVETEDTYLRLDRDLASFFTFLDNAVGKGNYLLFLTADHAGAHNPTFLEDNKIPAGHVSDSQIADSLNARLMKRLNTSEKLVEDVLNYQVFLDFKAIKRAKLKKSDVERAAVKVLLRDKRFAYVIPMDEIATASVPEPIRSRAINGYNRFRSGQIQVIMQPGWMEGSARGTNHGVWNPYDAHIPLLFMGWGIKTGSTYSPTSMTDIAPTVCALLNIQMPNGCIGNAIPQVIAE